ncbi:MAG TPA: ABC transporter substrate-binding protein [Chloroflexota bacterium]|nr:ABC transporter substrate-binding protein [Chloroflexota bacterium]
MASSSIRPNVGLANVAIVLSLGLAACGPAAAPAPPTAAPGKEAPTAAAVAKPAAAVAPTAKPEAKPQAKVALKSAFTSTSAALASITAAKEGGFFDEEGLDVSLSRIQAGAPVLAAMRGGDVPITIAGGQQIVEADLQGGDFVIVASFIDRLTQAIYVQPSIERPEQLRGKALGITNFGAITHVAGRVGLEQLGLKDQVTFIATGGPPETIAAMQAGKVEGGIFSPPDSFVAGELGYRELLDMKMSETRLVTGAIATTRTWARENPDLVERYIRASIRGTRRLISDREFGLQVIRKHAGIEDAKVLEETYNYFRDVYLRDGYPSLSGIQFSLDLAAEEIPAAKNAKPEEFVDLTFLDKMKASGVLERL